jgi:eukaryotic-like serine/threonine-protein kinase
LVTLGRYSIEGEIGRGAMGAVLVGRDPKDGRKVALKTLALGREFASEERVEARQRFFREAETAARLRHPGIVAIFDSGEDEGLAWIAMEYLTGHDLQRHTRPGKLLPVPVVLRIASRVSDALAYAHRHGVVHRDVKPANVMVDLASDSVKVTDFGIARIANANRTRTGMVLGTPSFMSPEQMAGRRVDGRSDLYSLGVMLFHLLCGQLPHRADSMAALMSQIVNQRAPDVRSLRPELPEALADLVALTLEKRSELRPADGRELALDLQLIAARFDGATEPAAPPEVDAGVDAFASTVKFSRGDPRHNPGD